jgi:hypothetical protein
MATVLGGIAFAAHFEAGQRFQEDAGMVRYAFRPVAAEGNLAPGSFVVQVRRQAFLGEMSPNEACELHVAGEKAGRDERWKACMSRFTGRQVVR